MKWYEDLNREELLIVVKDLLERIKKLEMDKIRNDGQNNHNIGAYSDDLI